MHAALATSEDTLGVFQCPNQLRSDRQKALLGCYRCQNILKRIRRLGLFPDHDNAGPEILRVKLPTESPYPKTQPGPVEVC